MVASRKDGMMCGIDKIGIIKIVAGVVMDGSRSKDAVAGERRGEATRLTSARTAPYIPRSLPRTDQSVNEDVKDDIKASNLQRTSLPRSPVPLGASISRSHLPEHGGSRHVHCASIQVENSYTSLGPVINYFQKKQLSSSIQLVCCRKSTPQSPPSYP